MRFRNNLIKDIDIYSVSIRYMSTNNSPETWMDSRYGGFGVKAKVVSEGKKISIREIFEHNKVDNVGSFITGGNLGESEYGEVLV